MTEQDIWMLPFGRDRLGATVRHSPFGCWDVWALRTFARRRLGTAVSALCRVIAIK